MELYPAIEVDALMQFQRKEKRIWKGRLALCLRVNNNPWIENTHCLSGEVDSIKQQLHFSIYPSDSAHKA